MHKIIVSDASPLIQITLAGYLWLLSKLYETVIPISALKEVQFYDNLPDAVEIVAATRIWLKVSFCYIFVSHASSVPL